MYFRHFLFFLLLLPFLFGCVVSFEFQAVDRRLTPSDIDYIALENRRRGESEHVDHLVEGQQKNGPINRCFCPSKKKKRRNGAL